MPVPAVVLSLPFALSHVFGGYAAPVPALEPAASVIVCVQTLHILGDFFPNSQPFVIIKKSCDSKTTQAAFEI